MLGCVDSDLLFQMSPYHRPHNIAKSRSIISANGQTRGSQPKVGVILPISDTYTYPPPIKLYRNNTLKCWIERSKLFVFMLVWFDTSIDGVSIWDSIHGPHMGLMSIHIQSPGLALRATLAHPSPCILMCRNPSFGDLCSSRPKNGKLWLAQKALQAVWLAPKESLRICCRLGLLHLIA